MQIGRDDGCAAGGGAQLITFGDIDFAANADGIEGASMISAGEINGTSSMDMAFCGTGMENNFEA